MLDKTRYQLVNTIYYSTPAKRESTLTAEIHWSSSADTTDFLTYMVCTPIPRRLTSHFKHLQDNNTINSSSWRIVYSCRATADWLATEDLSEDECRLLFTRAFKHSDRWGTRVGWISIDLVHDVPTKHFGWSDSNSSSIGNCSIYNKNAVN